MFMERRERRSARHQRVRKKVAGTPERPRLAIFRSGRHIYAQIIDDSRGHTLVAASSVQPDVQQDLGRKIGPGVAASKVVGAAVARKAKDQGITKVVFDRGGYLYHGRVKALADAAREAGLEF
ncbi:MAG TPA: 50S ribosomal protein L18 [Armatimonadota bacterium]|jgi:large subunit ribosomal protein L18